MAEGRKGIGYDFAINIAQGVNERLAKTREQVVALASSYKALNKEAKTATDVIATASKTQGFTDAELRASSLAAHYGTPSNVVNSFQAKLNGLTGAKDKGALDQLLGNIYQARKTGEYEGTKLSKTDKKGLGALENQIVSQLDGDKKDPSESREKAIRFSKEFFQLNSNVSEALGKVGKVGRIALEVVIGGFIAATAAAGEFIHKMSETQQMLQRSQVFFGNMTNTVNTMEHAMQLIAKGELVGNINQVMEAMKDLDSVGLKGDKMLKVVSDIAGKTGHSIDDTARAVVSFSKGNAAALEQYGIQEAYAEQMSRRYHGNMRMMVQEMSGFISKQKGYANGTVEQVHNIAGSINRMKNQWELFKQGLMGRVDDKNSLISQVTQTFAHAADWLQKHSQKIGEIARGITLVLKWMWQEVTNVFVKISDAASASAQSSDGFFHNFRDKMMSFVLWLELTKERLKRFWADYGNIVKEGVALLAGVWVGTKVIEGIEMVTKAWATLRSVSIGAAVAQAAAWAAANPVAAAVAATAAIGAAALVYSKLNPSSGESFTKQKVSPIPTPRQLAEGAGVQTVPQNTGYRDPNQPSVIGNNVAIRDTSIGPNSPYFETLKKGTENHVTVNIIGSNTENFSKAEYVKWFAEQVQRELDKMQRNSNTRQGISTLYTH